MFREGVFDHHVRDYINAAASASGTTATGALGPVPQGYCWYLEHASTYSNSSGTPLLELYIEAQDQVDASGLRQNRIDYTTAGKNDITDYPHAHFIGPGQYLVAAWTSLNSNDRCVLAAQIAIHELIHTRDALALEGEPRGSYFTPDNERVMPAA